MISVITPNKAGREIITDLDFQTYTDFEWIVIKDKELKGQSWALNRGIEKARGEYLMFLDDDLNIENTLLEDLYKALDGTEHSLAYCSFKKMGLLKGTHRSQPWDFEELKKYNYISACSMVMAKDFPGWDEGIKRLKDWDVWLTMGAQGKTGVWVDRALFTAHFEEDGISTYNDGGSSVKIIKAKHNL